RGKGSRRVPWRDGGKGRRKRAEWRKQAPHAVNDLSLLSQPVAELQYECPGGRSPAEGIYLFDQRIARSGIGYHAELHGSRFWPVFTIRVAADCAETVCAIIAEIGRRRAR